MADQNTNPTTDQNATTTSTDTTVEKKPFATIEEANANKPTGKVRLYRVTRPNRSAVFVWSANTVEALAIVTKADGYSASSAGTQVSRQKVTEGFATLSDEEKLAFVACLPPELLAKIAPPAPAPAADKPTKGRGK